MAEKGEVTNRHLQSAWACETWATFWDFFFFSLLFCIPRLGQVRVLQSGTSNSAGTSLFLISDVLASPLGNFAPGFLAV